MSDLAFDHFVLTRFNTELPTVGPPNEDWLRRRLELFRATALPSIRQQIVPPDRWLVFCDRASPKWFVDEMQDALGTTGECVWISGPFSPEVAGNECHRRRTSTRYLITTRLDNDDLVSEDFLEHVQARFSGQSFAFLNFTHGYQLARSELYRRSDPLNAFVSLVEETDSDSGGWTVFLDQHDRLRDHGEVYQISGEATWIQVIHGANLANRARGIRIRPTRRRLRRFPDLPALNHRRTVAWRLVQLLDALKLIGTTLARVHRMRWAAMVASAVLEHKVRQVASKFGR